MPKLTIFKFNMKKYILIIIFFSVLALSTAVFNSKFQKLDEGKPSDYQKVRMVLTTSGNNMGINTLTAKKFAEIVKKESGGNVIIDVYDNDQLAGGNASLHFRYIFSIKSQNGNGYFALDI